MKCTFMLDEVCIVRQTCVQKCPTKHFLCTLYDERCTHWQSKPIRLQVLRPVGWALTLVRRQPPGCPPPPASARHRHRRTQFLHRPTPVPHQCLHSSAPGFVRHADKTPLACLLTGPHGPGLMPGGRGWRSSSSSRCSADACPRRVSLVILACVCPAAGRRREG
jgi:hypothetical protein